MKKWLKIVLVMLLILGALVGMGFWLLTTEGGTRVLLRAAFFISPYRIDAREIKGKILEGIRLEGLQVRGSQFDLMAKSLEIRWQGRDLWERKLTIHELVLKDGHIHDHRAVSGFPPDLKWPSLPFWLFRFQGRLDSFRLEGLNYQRLNENPISLEAISFALAFQEGRLTLQAFSLKAPWGSARADGEAAFDRPALRLHLEAKLSRDFSPFENIFFRLNLAPALKPEQMAGTVQVRAMESSIERLLLEGNLGVTRNSLRFHSFRLKEGRRKGTIQGNGELSFAVRPPLRLQLNLTGLDLEPEIGIPTAISATIKATGAPEKYSGQFRLANSGKGWEDIRASGSLRGNLGACEFSNLDISWLEGTLKGMVRLGWVKDLSLSGQVQGRGLNPSIVVKEVKGKINLNLEGDFRFRSQKPPQGTLTGELLESQISGFPLKGDLQLVMEDGLLRLSPLTLRGKDFDIRAEGILQEKVNLQANLADLSRFVPGLGGNLYGKGWIRYRERKATGMMTGQGKNWSFGQARAETIEATLHARRLSGGEEPLLALEARLGKISAGPASAESLFVSLNGSPNRHQAEFALHHRKGKIGGRFTGAYGDGLWKGTVERLEGQDPIGRWALKSPAPMALSSREWVLSSARIESTKGEGLELSCQLTLNPLLGSASAKWHKVDLAHANLWLREGKITGRTSGALAAEIFEEGPKFSGSIDFKGAYARDPFSLSVSAGIVNLLWGSQGLSASWNVDLDGKGKFQGKATSPDPARMAMPERGKIEAEWDGLDLTLLRPHFPPSLQVEGRLSGRLRGLVLPGRVWEASGETRISRGNLNWKRGAQPIQVGLERGELNWQWEGNTLKGDLSLAMAHYGWLTANLELPISSQISPKILPTRPVRVRLKGQAQEKGLLAVYFPEIFEESRGTIDFNIQADGTWNQPKISGSCEVKEAGLSFRMNRDPLDPGKDPLKLPISSGKLDFRWDRGGLWASSALDLNGQGTLTGNLSSPEPARMAIPDRGKGRIQWESIDLALVRRFLPPDLFLNGQVSGHMEGQYRPGLHLDLIGEAQAVQGSIHWKGNGGMLSAALETAKLQWTWKEEVLTGTVSLALTQYGRMKGDFQLPLPARIPSVLNASGAIRLSLEGEAQESGLITALFPGVIQESRGRFEFDLRGTGTWEKPQLTGRLQMTQAGAKVPDLGIQIQGLEARLRLEDQQVVIESIRAQSGPGRIEGQGRIRLEGWRVTAYEGHLRGDRFQALYLPEARIQGNPNLNIQGDLKKLTVRGEILFPEFLIYGEPAGKRIGPSSDVIILDDPPPGRKFPLALDLQVRLILGDRVIVSAHGIDARLEGSLDLKATEAEKVTAQGEVRVAEGHYATYGLKLKILRGRFIFTGGPIDRPELDIQAMKQVKDVQVGILVSGTPQTPIAELYSKPPMADTDILSYIVLGRPFSASTNPQEVDLLMVAAGALLSRAESVSLQDRIKGFLWFDTIDVQSGGGDLSRSMATIGKYLTPDLYVSLGYSLFDNTQLLTVRYKITKQWEVETKWGTQGGVDLSYRIEFY